MGGVVGRVLYGVRGLTGFGLQFSTLWGAVSNSWFSVPSSQFSASYVVVDLRLGAA